MLENYMLKMSTLESSMAKEFRAREIRVKELYGKIEPSLSISFYSPPIVVLTSQFVFRKATLGESEDRRVRFTLSSGCRQQQPLCHLKHDCKQHPKGRQLVATMGRSAEILLSTLEVGSLNRVMGKAPGHFFDGHIIDGHFFDGTYFRRDIFSTDTFSTT